ncbi:trypsin-like peptidase domain-containing protein [Thermomonospora umbrina]|uniref:Trypsin-like peptidase n=1 Tax=Thermomonospora umbrina TaxID=111806 RepID=A0A3D9SLD9_9ACTN|nr:trypsin-like peptidase domain-containing protein [Thermomonospora umbrina]REE96729.1 trypsin-like peptidase [Thermomonospora umbrina]
MSHFLRKLCAAGAVLVAGFAVPAGVAQAETKVSVGPGTGIIQRVGLNPDGQVTAFYVCTLTAIGHDGAGNLVGLSNAHCFIDDAGNKLVGDKVYVDTTPPGSAASPAPFTVSPETLQIGPIGEVTYVSTPNNLLTGGTPGLDYAVIKLDPAKVAPTPTVTSPSGTTTVTSIGEVPAWGTRMCKQGHRTGVTCGATLGRNGLWYRTLIWTLGGDSGAPVINGNALVGSAFGAQHFTPITSILADMNAQGGVGAGFHLG